MATQVTHLDIIEFFSQVSGLGTLMCNMLGTDVVVTCDSVGGLTIIEAPETWSYEGADMLWMLDGKRFHIFLEPQEGTVLLDL